MRAPLLAMGLSVLMVSVGSGSSRAEKETVALAVAGSGDVSSDQSIAQYHGYYLDLSEIAGQQNYSVIVGSLQHQLDIVDSVGLNQRVLQFFRTIPIVVDNSTCLETKSTEPGQKERPPVLARGCFGPSRPPRFRDKQRNVTYLNNATGNWVNPDPVELAEDTRRGIIMLRARVMPETPTVLHEMLHAFHLHMMAYGFDNPSITFYYDKAKGVFPTQEYLMSNKKEFFAVTASVFLYGKDDKEPFTRATLKQKQPDYYNFLVWLFGFDPEKAPGAAPVASIN